MDTNRTKTNTYRRANSSLDMKKTMPLHRRGSIRATKSGIEGIDSMGSAWNTNDHSVVQNKEKENIKMNVIQCYEPTNDNDGHQGPVL